MKIILVGNGTSVLDQKYGSLVDSFDIIVRFNDFTIKGFEEYVGKKTNCWITCEAYHINTIKDFDRVILHTWEYNDSHLVKVFRRHGKFEITKEREVSQIPTEWPSTGLIGIYKFIKEYGHVTIFGFDWWERKEHHYFPMQETDRSYIKKKDHNRGTLHNPKEEYSIIKKLEQENKLSFLSFNE